jgi:lysozyme
MRTSEAGKAALIADEGEVLNAYPDVKGVWTIGVGLTAASGLITPKRGMTITREESRRLFAIALEKKYEPSVNAMFANVAQHVFDGSVSFHYNTGAIRTATWVSKFKAGLISAAKTSFLSWNKSGGTVVRGLTLRRGREWKLISEGVYPHGIKPDVAPVEPAPVVVEEPIKVLREGSKGEAVVELQRKLAALNLYKGSLDGDFGPKTKVAVAAFQRLHPVLIVDGIAGPATLAQLQRVADAKAKTVTYGAVSTAAIATSVGTMPLWVAAIPAAVAVGAIAWTVWRYRDEFKVLMK